MLNLGHPVWVEEKERERERERSRREDSERRVYIHMREFLGRERGALTPRLRHILRPAVPQLQLRRMRAQPPPCRSLQLRTWPVVPLIGVSSTRVTLRPLLLRPETTTMTRHARLKQAQRQTERMIWARNDTSTVVPRGLALLHAENARESDSDSENDSDWDREWLKKRYRSWENATLN